MTIIEKQARILNDLVLINNDRVVGYEKAIEELKKDDADLKILFREKINQSNNFKTELSEEITKIGHKTETGTTNAGKIYRVWMDVKTFFGGAERKVILDNCVDGEDAAVTSYDDALTSEGLTTEIRSLLTRHLAELKISFNRVKALKDAQK
ncbi:MAG: PA2169 family four-helix-bundle protein [Bacteroidales bacterium]|jgi:uncharacterized protein (TIGR02284 family)|nr:PA2169 family four-helix-bundle protein [Bacteroidales bacterium]